MMSRLRFVIDWVEENSRSNIARYISSDSEHATKAISAADLFTMIHAVHIS